MNYQNFELPGGYPFDENTLADMQSAYNIFNSLGQISGDYTIIKGCEVIGNNIADGFLYMDGELFPFVGGSIQSKVIVKETKTRLPFLDGSEPEVLVVRYITFGTGTTAVDWSLFSKPLTNKELTSIQSEKADNKSLEELAASITVINQRLDVFVKGGAMVFWNKPATEIPEGWEEVTDWRGRMPVGFDPTQTEFNLMGKEGGEKTQTLTEPQMPKHKHSKSDNFNKFVGMSSNVKNSSTSDLDGNDTDDQELAIGSLTSTIQVLMTEQTKGSGESFNILNPYRTVLFIEYTGA